MTQFFTTASVKVMRSHDYCHFEVVLGINKDTHEAISPYDVDLMRKEAARLADKAVEQYKVAKQNAQRILDASYGYARVKALADDARLIPESERTSEQMAHIKALQDYIHHQKYDYQDDWDDDND